MKHMHVYNYQSNGFYSSNHFNYLWAAGVVRDSAYGVTYYGIHHDCLSVSVFGSEISYFLK